MNSLFLQKLLIVACGAFGAQLASAAQTWNLGNSSGAVAENTYSTNGCVMTGGYGNTMSCNQGAANTPVTATMTGWVTSGSIASPATATSTFTTGYLNSQGTNGIGLQDRTEDTTVIPYHAVDSKGNTEVVAINFSKSIRLDQVNLGWTSEGSDFSILAWTGAGAPPSLSGKTVSGSTGLIAAGWSLVGQYTASATQTVNDDTNRSVNVNAGKVTSSYWLIGAFNTAYNGAGSGNIGVDGVADAWKLLSVVGTAAVPEPGSIALVALGLIAAGSARRSKTAAA